MDSSFFYRVIYEKFKKRGVLYECVIAPRELEEEPGQFQVIIKCPGSDLLKFLLFFGDDGHWQPDNKRLVDPWLADTLGQIIMNNY